MYTGILNFELFLEVVLNYKLDELQPMMKFFHFQKFLTTYKTPKVFI